MSFEYRVEWSKVRAIIATKSKKGKKYQTWKIILK